MHGALPSSKPSEGGIVHRVFRVVAGRDIASMGAVHGWPARINWNSGRTRALKVRSEGQILFLRRRSRPRSRVLEVPARSAGSGRSLRIRFPAEMSAEETQRRPDPSLECPHSSYSAAGRTSAWPWADPIIDIPTRAPPLNTPQTSVEIALNRANPSLFVLPSPQQPLPRTQEPQVRRRGVSK